MDSRKKNESLSPNNDDMCVYALISAGLFLYVLTTYLPSILPANPSPYKDDRKDNSQPIYSFFSRLIYLSGLDSKKTDWLTIYSTVSLYIERGFQKQIGYRR